MPERAGTALAVAREAGLQEKRVAFLPEAESRSLRHPWLRGLVITRHVFSAPASKSPPSIRFRIVLQRAPFRSTILFGLVPSEGSEAAS